MKYKSVQKLKFYYFLSVKLLIETYITRKGKSQYKYARKIFNVKFAPITLK